MIYDAMDFFTVYIVVPSFLFLVTEVSFWHILYPLALKSNGYEQQCDRVSFLLIYPEQSLGPIHRIKQSVCL